MTDYRQIDRDEIEILQTEQLEAGTVNDNPNHAFAVVLPNGERGWMAGPDGVSCCAITEWLRYTGAPAATREEAIEAGCDLQHEG
jgi:hypothetical protein